MPKKLSSRLSNGSYSLFVYGLGGICLVILIVPVLISLIMSFTSAQTLKFPPEGLSFRWYAALFDPAQSGELQQAAWNTFQIAVWAVLASLVFAAGAPAGAVFGILPAPHDAARPALEGAFVTAYAAAQGFAALWCFAAAFAAWLSLPAIGEVPAEK